MADAAGRTNAQPFTAESNYRSTIDDDHFHGDYRHLYHRQLYIGSHQ